MITWKWSTDHYLDHPKWSHLKAISLLWLIFYCKWLFGCWFCFSLDMIRRRSLRTRAIKLLVLDEADEMLNKGTNGRSSQLLFSEVNTSLIAEALFLLFADRRKETSVMGREWLWFNRRPQSWTALLRRILLALFADRNLSPLCLAHLFTRIPAVIYRAHIVNMTCSDRCEQSACGKNSIVKSY